MEATWAGSPSEVTRVLDTSVMAVTHNTAAFLDSLFSLVDVDLCSASYVYLLYSPFQRSDFVETEVATSNSPTFRWTHSSAPPPVWPPSPSSWVRSCWGETRFFKFYFLCCVMSVNIALKKTIGKCLEAFLTICWPGLASPCVPDGWLPQPERLILVTQSWVVIC